MYNHFLFLCTTTDDWDEEKFWTLQMSFSSFSAAIENLIRQCKPKFQDVGWTWKTNYWQNKIQAFVAYWQEWQNQTETESNWQKMTENDRNRQKQSETDRNWQKQSETDSIPDKT